MRRHNEATNFAARATAVLPKFSSVPKAGGTDLDLTATNDVLHLDPLMKPRRRAPSLQPHLPHRAIATRHRVPFGIGQGFALSEVRAAGWMLGFRPNIEFGDDGGLAPHAPLSYSTCATAVTVFAALPMKIFSPAIMTGRFKKV